MHSENLFRVHLFLIRDRKRIMTEDPTAASRKKDHIDLAFASRVESLDDRFDYEPLLSAHPRSIKGYPKSFLDKQIQAPIWVSSMTGGTAKAKTINVNIAKACKEFGLGMGLGSCRSILESNDRLSDFAVREHIGDQGLYANLGIAQIENLVDDNKLHRIDELVKTLEADGLIIHINPLQEWLQTEGDLIRYRPIDTIKKVLDFTQMSIIVKEVGQGMGPASLTELLKLPIDAIEFAASGGTNFSMLEMLRGSRTKKEAFEGMARIGQSASDMISILNRLIPELGHEVNCRNFIISGGVKDYLDGYYFINELQHNAIYGQAAGFLKHAQDDYDTLREYVALQIEGLQFASAFLRNKK